ncbi:hypothetical protein Tco_1127286 [Tanacetum coccineum]
MIGSLVYLTTSRLDIQFSTYLCARFKANPKESHLIAVERIFRYLKGTPSLGLWYPKCSGFDLKGYSDSDNAGCNMVRKSTSSACQLLGGKLMKIQLFDYDIIYEKVPIFCDYKNAISISNNPVLHSRTKDIDMRYHFIRDHIMKGAIESHFIPTQYQLADIFTKPLDESTFKRLIVELDQVEFTFDEITFSTNNEVPLLYPSHPKSKYFEIISDFISKCCLKEAFTRASNQYIEYIVEFWYTVKALEDSKIWVSTPTGGIRGEIGPPFTEKAIYNTDVPVESQALKTSLKAEKKSSLTKDKSSSHLSASTLVVAKIHKEVKQETSGLTSLGANSEEGAYPQLSSGCDALVDSKAEVDPGISAPNDSIPSQKDKTKSAGNGLKTAHTNLDKCKKEETKRYEDTHATSQDEPKDTSIPHPPSPKLIQIQELMAQVLLLQSLKLKLEQQKEKAEVKVAFLKA